MTSSGRRKVWIAAAIVWNTAGGFLTFLWRNELWWVQVMSHAAITIALLTGWAAETPVEHEQDSDS